MGQTPFKITVLRKYGLINDLIEKQTLQTSSAMKKGTSHLLNKIYIHVVGMSLPIKQRNSDIFHDFT